METTILTFLNLAALVAEIVAFSVTIRRLKLQGKYVEQGRGHINVPVMWPAVIAGAAWLWLIAGWIM